MLGYLVSGQVVQQISIIASKILLVLVVGTYTKWGYNKKRDEREREKEKKNTNTLNKLFSCYVLSVGTLRDICFTLKQAFASSLY